MMLFPRQFGCKWLHTLTLVFMGSLNLACTSSGNQSTQGTGGHGGASSHGGATAMGGVTSMGGASAPGGAPATGGSFATGGIVSTGGKLGTGGMTSSGDDSSTGGVTSTGGNVATGGVTGQGGQRDASINDGPVATGDAGGAGGATVADAAGDAPKPTSYNIMAFGDSITATMCPPQMLDQELKAKGHSNFTFVGTKVANQSCNGAPDTKCEGQGGIWATNLVPGGANPDLMAQWATGSQYDVVLMHLGTNDCWSPGAVPDLQSVIDAFSYIIDTFRTANPKVIVFVAQIIPLNPSNCTTCESRVEQLNAMIPAFVASKTTAAAPVFVADIHAAFDGLSYTPNSTYSSDGAHPTPAGSQLMADAWYAALQAHGIP